MTSPFKIPSSCEEGEWRLRNWGHHVSDVWPEDYPQPRTCSFCGSIHPEDLITLMRAGWEFERTTKGYKSYINPPGYKAHSDAVMLNFPEHMAGKLPPFVQPLPPVKLYHNHLTPENAAEIHSILLIRKVKG